MAEYYRTIFTIEEPVQGLELLGKVEDEARKWAGYEFGEPLGGVRGELGGAEGRLRFGTRSVGESGIFWLVWERPDPQDAELGWRLGLRLASEGDDMEADIEVQGLEDEHEKFQARPPDVVSILFTNFHCTLDGSRLTTKARRVTLGEEASFRDELLDLHRSVPLLVVSEETMDADYLQRQLLGLVTVISYDRDTAWEISKNLPSPLRCYDGAIRLYSPGCYENDVSQQHPYWLPGDVEHLDSDEGRMCRILRDECVNRLPRHGRRRLFSRVRDSIRRQGTQVLKAEIVQQKLDDNALLALLTDEEIIGDVDSVSRARYDALATVAKSFKNKNDRIEAENKRLKDSDGLPERDSPSSETDSTQSPQLAPDDAKPQLDTVLEVVEKASELDGLRFFPSAFESAESVTKAQFKKTDELLRVFECMNECAGKRAGGLGSTLTQWFEYRNVSYAIRESESTWERYREDRTFDGIYMGEHFKLRDGKRFMLRVHVSWDKKENYWRVGWVGPHRPTSSDPH